MILDLASFEDHTALQTDTVSNDDVGSNCHVGSNATVTANLGRWVDKDVAAMDVRGAGGRQELGILLGERGEIEASPCEEILGLSDIHPEALQVKGVQLSILAHRWESFLLNRCRSELDAVQHTWAKNVDTCVNSVPDEFDWLLDEAVNSRVVVRLVDNDTIFRWLLDLCDNNGTLVTVCFVKCKEFREWVLADDIGVENKEGLGVLSQDLLSQLKRTSSSQGFGLDGECNLDVEALFVLLIISSQLPVQKR